MKIKRGDVVRITQRMEFEGTVLSVDGEEGDWMIEIKSPDFGYMYWKQGIDGGEVRMIRVGPELVTARQIITKMRDAGDAGDTIRRKLQAQHEGFRFEIHDKNLGPLYDSVCIDMTIPGYPPVSVYIFYLWDDALFNLGTLTLIGEEAYAMDRLLNQTPDKQ